MEKSKLDAYLPRYFKGYDVDMLLHKIKNHQILTSEEEEIINEVIDIYHDMEYEKRRQKVEEKKQDDSWKKDLFAMAREDLAMMSPFIDEIREAVSNEHE